MSGPPSRSRTCNPQLRRLVLYPIELWAEKRRWCRGEESNLRPSRYECAALPTELHRQFDNGIGVGARRRPRFPWKTFFPTREDRIAIENSLPSDYESSEVASERYRIAGAAPGVRTRRIRFAHRCVLRLTRDHALVACAFQVGTVLRKRKNGALSAGQQASRWCPRPDSNRHALRRRILSPLRLPIPPLGQDKLVSVERFELPTNPAPKAGALPTALHREKKKCARQRARTA